MNATVDTDTAAQLVEVSRQIKLLTEQKKFLCELMLSEHGTDKASFVVPGQGRVNIIEESISEQLDPFAALAEILDVSLGAEDTQSQKAAVLCHALKQEGLTPPMALRIRQASVRVTVNQ